jgi:transposase
MAATVAEPGEFHSGRQFAAGRGLVPRQNSPGGKTRLCGIGKRGDSYLRRLRGNGARAARRRAKAAKADPWLIGLRGRRPRLVVAGALANKTARLAWAIRGGSGITCRAAAEPQACGASGMAKPVDRRIAKNPVSQGTVIPPN